MVYRITSGGGVTPCLPPGRRFGSPALQAGDQEGGHAGVGQNPLRPGAGGDVLRVVRRAVAAVEQIEEPALPQASGGLPAQIHQVAEAAHGILPDLI